MNKIVFNAVVSLLVLATLTNTVSAGEIKTSDIVSIFKKKLTEYIKSYPTPKEVSKHACGYINQYYTIDPNYKYDIKSTDSLVSPVVAFLEFRSYRYDTKCHSTYAEAISDNNFEKSPTDLIDLTLHRHEYAFRDGKWFVTSRKLLMATSYSQNWLGSNESGSKKIFLESN